MNDRDHQILRIALPSIVSNVTVPLLGMVDVAIVGHMGNAAYIGAVAVGSMIFNLVYWLFGFLRMSTSGMTSQALGRRDLSEVTSALARSFIVSLAIALALIALQVPLKWLMFWLIEPTADVLPLAADYFRIVIWGAPASLALFSLTGWYIGMQNTRIPMLVSIMQNVVNIFVSLLLVYGFGMKIEGVAAGTVIAQYVALTVALLLLAWHYGRLRRYFVVSGIFVKESIGRYFTVNRDIFLRTLCLVAVNLFFTSAGARQGAVILSVNTVLLQLYLFFSYFMDGFAYAGEALCGKAYGAHNTTAFRETLRRLWMWMVIVTLSCTLLYMVADTRIVSLLTDSPQVIGQAGTFLPWIWFVPLAGCVAFIWDGVFIGITATRGMLVASVVSALAFFSVYFLMLHLSVVSSRPSMVNHGLWLAQVVYLSMRGIVQTVWYNKLYSNHLHD